jgi:hypothetical protein
VRLRRSPVVVEVDRSSAAPAAVDPVAGAVAFVRWLLTRHGCATDDPAVFYCPCCTAATPSLRCTEARDYLSEGLALLECETGCASSDVLSALGLRVAYADRDGVLRLSAVIPLAVA